MRRVNFNNIKPSYEGEGGASIKPGMYACKITAAKDVPEREYIELLLDICEGEHAGEFRRDFYLDKPYAHHLILSYKEAALSMTLGRLECISACNPGFDAVAAIEGGREDLLVTRRCYVAFRCEEYYNKKTDAFEVGSNPRPGYLVKPDKYDPGVEVKPSMLSEKKKLEALKRAGIYNPEAHLREMQLTGEVQAAPSSAVADAYDGGLPF